ncbi:phage major capsid protein [Rhizobium phaseoli]|uniref:phage major capsid protein n=1 Tax=Rhizobium phaseoli TaxID=396 RepID=UPI0002D26623|nr:phage major capsid protein [Rhizobium phaseoli]KKZ89368.1 phage-related protein [Rhizobium phaseoli Ch24-10]
MVSVEILPKGMNFTRLALALALSDGDDLNAAGIAEARWGASSAPARILRSVGAGTYSDMGGEFKAAATEFFAVVEQLSVLGRLAGFRRVPLRTRMLTATSGTSAFWVEEGKPKPVSTMTFASGALASLKIAALAIVTEELAMSLDPAAEGVVRRDMIRVMVEAIDENLLDPANSGVAGVSPASITNGVTPISASTDPTADLRVLIENFDGNLESATFIMTPSVAASLAGADRPGIGLRGGELLGAPAVASRSAPADTIIIIDTSALALGEGPSEIRTSRAAAIEMLDDDLDQDATTGTGTSLVSLWQANCLGILAEKQMNWEIQRAGAVSMIAGTDYSPVVS